jgi:hypothetical protein
MHCRFTVHFSTLFSTTRRSFRKMWLCSRADLTTLGFCISLVTSASVALGDCFFCFLLPIHPRFHESAAFTGQFGSSLARYFPFTELRVKNAYADFSLSPVVLPVATSFLGSWVFCSPALAARFQAANIPTTRGSYLTLPPHKTRLVVEVVTTFSSFRFPELSQPI